MEFLFRKRVLIIITIVILSCTLISALLQIFVFDSKEKRIIRAMSNANIVTYDDWFSSKICDQRTEHDFEMYIFCDYEKGCYFGHSSNDVEDTINSFVRKGTILSKQAKNSVVRFINRTDTLTVVYEIDQETGVLRNGVVC